MPNVILGPVIFNSNEGIITGAALNASPTSTSKVVAGSGGFNTGYWVVTNNWISSSGNIDPDVNDSNVNEVV
ncbi:spore germination protein PF [Bacillus mesophilus]|uniref:Spore germination protein n=1 Tax=Bacillus mesophilus TaxID=1808955 RepID=A0A6M0Q704_9BACI|nr:spore germination protein [Bacillus mesophilus]MBM7660927.1 spore germination protein PF [Bacillus mesophilus]NEY71529.1 spore germination protein [Bacillus mesophilus]